MHWFSTTKGYHQAGHISQASYENKRPFVMLCLETYIKLRIIIPFIHHGDPVARILQRSIFLLGQPSSLERNCEKFKKGPLKSLPSIQFRVPINTSRLYDKMEHDVDEHNSRIIDLTFPGAYRASFSTPRPSEEIKTCLRVQLKRVCFLSGRFTRCIGFNKQHGTTTLKCFVDWSLTWRDASWKCL